MPTHDPDPSRPPDATEKRPRRGRRVLAGAGLAAAAAGIAFLASWVGGQPKEHAGVDSEGRKANRLIDEKSPYLLQHAYNPVDWYPWGEEAFEKARTEDKPIFLSVGYSTCHWCHVMERESFDDPEIAAQINESFVPIKVDREERPDVDRVYMNAAYAITGGGGWPLTVFLTPDRKPFYAGTYFPPEDRYGRPGLPTVLQGVSRAWTEQREQVLESAQNLTQAIRKAMVVEPDTTGVVAEELMRRSAEGLAARYDESLGGFGRAPKFPQPPYLAFLFRWHARTGDEAAKTMALESLRKMSRGGMYDHLGGGFHRYSTDAEWKVPHFEKMLYDQAQLVWAHLDAYQITGDRFFADVARDVLAYVERDLRHPEGGFYSAEDADSPVPGGEPEEGAFYVWTTAEVESILGAERAAPFLAHYHMTEEGNFEHGKNVLHAPETLAVTAERFGAGEGELAARFAEDRERLFRARAPRPRPHLDDKVLTAWNGLMISAFARAAPVLGEERWLERARQAAAFVLERSWNERRGELKRRFRDGESAIAGELTDYAFFTQGLLDLYEASGELRWLEAAAAITEVQVERFWDEERGGFFDTAEGESGGLFVRTKETHDGAEPAGNSIAVMNLARLAQMAGRDEYVAMARRTVDLFSNQVARNPLAMTLLWTAADFLLAKPTQVVLAGEPGGPEVAALLEVVHEHFLPRKVLLYADGGAGQKWLAERQPFLETVRRKNGRATAYVCQDFVCKLPTAEPEEMERQLLAVAEPAAAGR